MDQRYTRFRNNTILVIMVIVSSKLMSFIVLPIFIQDGCLLKDMEL